MVGKYGFLRALATMSLLPLPTDGPNRRALQGSEGDTALHLAALYGHEACVRVLLAHGARVDAADEEGALPLHDAAAGGYHSILQVGYWP